MSRSGTTLVMAGAREAHGIVAALAEQGREVIVSLPEPERMFEPFEVPSRTGPFTGIDGFTAWLEAQGVDRIIDASHAFDAEVSSTAWQAAQARGLPYLRVLRPEWRATDADNWTTVASIKEAAESVPSGARLFSNTGWLSLPAFQGFRGARLFLRQTHEVQNPPPYDFVTILAGVPPFSVKEEIALFRDLNVTHLICRNVGGAASATKLVAARELGLPVYMVARAPHSGEFPVAETVAKALEWDAVA